MTEQQTQTARRRSKASFSLAMPVVAAAEHHHAAAAGPESVNAESVDAGPVDAGPDVARDDWKRQSPAVRLERWWYSSN